MQANLTVLFDLNAKDRAELSHVIALLETVTDEFEKCGNGNTAEIEALRHASHILDEILRGEAF